MKKSRGLGHLVIALAALGAGCGKSTTGGHVGTGASVTKMVGPGGAMVAVEGIQLMVPAGAVTGEVPITVTSTTETAPTGFQAASPVYRLTPEGLTFTQPIEVRISLAGGTDNVTVFWSKLSGSGFDNVGGTIAGNTIVASNTHFSTMFAAEKPAILAAAPATHDFGSVVVGATSAITGVTVSNVGVTASDPLTAALTGPNASQFQISSSSCGPALAAGAACQVTLQYVPSMAGAASATLTVTGGLGGDATVALTATGLPPASLVVAPASRDFGVVTTGTTSATSIVTVTNAGGNASGVLTVSFGGSFPTDFQLGSDTCSGLTLAPAATCTLAVRFAPSAAGARTGTVVVTGSPGGSASAALSGMGQGGASLAISNGAQDFGSVPVGATSTPMAFTVSNGGGVASGSVVASLSGADAGQFRIGANTCTTALAPAATCSLQVSFAPTTPGARTATLTVSGSPGGAATAALTATGQTAASLAITPTLNNYGALETGTSSAPVSFTLTNNGGTTTGTLSATLTGANAAELQIGGNSCSVLAPGATCVVQVRFAPTSAGAKTASLSISGSAGESVTAALSGTGLAPASLTLSPANHDYGLQPSGTTSAASRFTLTNNGGVVASALAVSLGGTSPAEFQLGTSTCAGTLAAAASCTIDVSFAPSSSGAKSALLIVNGSPGSTSAALTGGGLTPASLTLSPPTHDYGPQVTATTSASFTFTASNPGAQATGALNIALTGVNPGDFTVTADTCSTTALAAAATCTVVVRFAPTAAGSRAATLTVSGGAGQSASAALTGTGQAPAFLTLSPANSDFGGRQTGTTSAATTFVVRNGGDVTSGVLGVALAGSDGDQFLIGANSCTTLASGATCTVTVSFAPTTTGPKSASLTVSGAGTATAPLSGTGLGAATLSVSPPVAGYGSVVVGGSSAAVTFTLANSGGVASGVINVSLTGSNPADFQVVTNTCGVLTQGATCTVGVNFAPGSRGTKTASLTIGATPGGTVTAALSGSGLAPASLVLSPTVASYGTLATGSTSSATVFTVSNAGDVASGAVTTALVGADLNEFQLGSTTCGAALAPAATCTAQVSFAPTSSGSKTASLTASTTGSTVSAALSGTGAAPAAFAMVPSLHDFGSVAVSSTSPGSVFTVINTGGCSSGAVNVALGGSNPGDFGIQGTTCGAAMIPSQTCTVTVNFSPTTTGPRTASLQVSSGAVNVTAALSGSGL